MNRLLLGDNLTVLDQIEDGSIDLIYLDPPFNSGRDYTLTDLVKGEAFLLPGGSQADKAALLARIAEADAEDRRAEAEAGAEEEFVPGIRGPLIS